MNAMYENLFGNYRTRTFSDIFPSLDEFNEAISECPIPLTANINAEKIALIYYLLYSRFGNSHIASMDENRFTFQLISLIWQHAPLWIRHREIQDALNAMSIDEFMEGGKAIYNRALDPGYENTAATTNTTALNHINEQNATNYLKSKSEGYAAMLGMLERDVTDEFLNKFKNLFLKIVIPDNPLWYVEEV